MFCLLGLSSMRGGTFCTSLPLRYSHQSLFCCRKCSSVAFCGLSAHSLQLDSKEIRVRFAPSPTGSLHVGGARTALYNYLFARLKGGKFILRIEDTDVERSTRQSEKAMLQDLSWLGLEWDEGPDIGGKFGPYRQSARNNLYKHFAEKLLSSGAAYRCFCSNEELEQMKEMAKEKHLPPVYTGKWANASVDEIEEELARGTPYTYRFRVPKDGNIHIDDLIRGEVGWNLNTLGDFVILRSNDHPVYNFSVVVDDAAMHITHVIRAEEHLTNTLRQVLLYKALNFTMPLFAHVSLILAPDRSKLSKRHGATSVGQFRKMGYLPEAMVNYLALLGWGDGTENEFFTLEQLAEKFSLERVNKSGAIFDLSKLRWMNGQYLRMLPTPDLVHILGRHWKSTNILAKADEIFVEEVVCFLKDRIDVVTDADELLSRFLSYPLFSTLASPEGEALIKDHLHLIASALLSSYASGDLGSALEEGQPGWQKWLKVFGISQGRKGKSLFAPLRVLLTGKLHGPDLGMTVVLLYKASICSVVSPEFGFATLDKRFSIIREINWDAIAMYKPYVGDNTQ